MARIRYHKPSSMQRYSSDYHQYDEAEVFLDLSLFGDKYDSGPLTSPSKGVSLGVVARAMSHSLPILDGHSLMKADVLAS